MHHITEIHDKTANNLAQLKLKLLGDAYHHAIAQSAKYLVRGNKGEYEYTGQNCIFTTIWKKGDVSISVKCEDWINDPEPLGMNRLAVLTG
jgi:hypothetical protein